MANIITCVEKISFAQNLSFSQREMHLNREILKMVDVFNNKGLIVVSHTPVTKTNTHATIKFELQKMFRI